MTFLSRFPPKTPSGWLDLVAFLMALASAIAMVFLYNPNAKVQLTQDVECADAEARMFCEVPASGRVGEPFPIGAISPIFLFLEATQYVVQFFSPRLYAKARSSGFNPFRWANYFFSASIMNVQIAFLSRLTNVFVAFGIFAATGTTMLCGAYDEYLFRDPVEDEATASPSAEADAIALLAGDGEKLEKARAGARTGWRRTGSHWAFWIGCLPFLWVWGAIYGAFGRAAARSSRGVPDFVYAIVISLFILESLFAVHFYLSYKRKGPWRSAAVRADGYTVLSWSKQLLAWLTYGGLINA